MKKFEAGAGLKTSMTDEREKHLEDMGFQWRMKDNANFWGERCAELKEFKEEHGHCRVPVRSGKLGVWAMHMRSTARRPKSKERIAKLDAIGLFD
jgi:hypothetical protein